MRVVSIFFASLISSSAGQQGDGAHLGQVHADRVVDALGALLVDRLFDDGLRIGGVEDLLLVVGSGVLDGAGITIGGQRAGLVVRGGFRGSFLFLLVVLGDGLVILEHLHARGAGGRFGSSR